MQTLTIRATLAAVVLSSTVAAFASAPDRDKTYPITPSAKHAQRVLVSFRNLTGQHRDVAIGEQRYSVSPSSELTLSIPVGSTVYERSDMNSKVDGKQILTATSNYNRHTVLLP